MGIRKAQRFFFGAVVMAMALPLLLTPQAVEGQEESSAVVEERLLAFARVHLEVAEIRDELHQELARYHEVDGRTRARQTADAKIEDAMEEHGVDPEEYQEFIAAISFDPDLMAAFEEALVRAREGADRD
jgi:hypothetical protein